MSALHRNLMITLLSTAVLTACTGAQRETPPELQRLQYVMSRVTGDPCIARLAAMELREADDAIALLLNDTPRWRGDRFGHNVYLANRLVQIAEAEGMARCADENAARFAEEREGLLLRARTADAQRAEARAEAERLEAERARLQAQAERSAAEQARLDALIERQRADAAQAELQNLRAMLAELQARETERGLVVTLGDVLFEVDRAELKPGAMRSLDTLASAMQRHERATIAIEGHTDSTGTRDYNLSLSQRRAESVMAYLRDRGVSAQRMAARGLSLDYPVASNATAAGRQQNRRVEIIIQQN
jgi:outer membrane protein OmpA-like peptidoglycan-associated protein